MDDLDLSEALVDATLGLGRTSIDELEIEVPCCPGWTVADLLGHVGSVHLWALEHLRADPASTERIRFPRPPAGCEVVDWYRSSAAALVHELGEASLDSKCRTFTGVQHRRWWLRRQVHETNVHRFDRDDACGRASVIDPALAVDGVDEMLELFVPHLEELGVELVAQPATMHLHAIDTDGEWLVHLDPRGTRWERTHAKGDVAVRGSAADLLLLLWGRREPAALEVFGDVGILERWQAIVSIR